MPTMPAEQLFPQQAGSPSNANTAAATDTGSSSSSGAAGGADSSSSVVPGLSAELQAALDLTNSYRRCVIQAVPLFGVLAGKRHFSLTSVDAWLA